MIKYFIWGVVAKAIASFDDAITRIPIIAQVTKTRRGRVAFSIGNIVAVTLAIGLAWVFSSLIEQFNYAREITAGLLILLAVAVYFDVFNKKKPEKIKDKEKQIKAKISSARFFYLVKIGFIVSLVTLLDDFIVLTSLFLGSLRTQLAATIGIYVATFIQIIIMIYLAEKMSGMRYTKEIAAVGLVVLAIIVYFGLI